MHPSGVAKSSTSFGWGKGWNVTSAGWQVTLCDPIWHVSSSSGEACCELLYPVSLLYYYYFTSAMAWTKNIQRKTREQPPLQLTRDQVVCLSSMYEDVHGIQQSKPSSRDIHGVYTRDDLPISADKLATFLPYNAERGRSKVPNGRPRPRRTR